MSSATLAAAGAIALVVGVSYVLVAWGLRRREGIRPESQRALGFFAVWWGALGVNIALAGALYVSAAFQTPPLWLQVTDSVVQRLLLAYSMIGLMAYLSFVATGRDRLKTWVVVYAAYFVFTLASLVYVQPVGVLVTSWRTDLAFARDDLAIDPAINFALLILPPMAGAIAYLRLFRRAESPAQKFRIALVSASIMLWWILAVIAGQRAALGADSFQVTQRVLGLVTALAVLVAYRPPAFVRRRLGVEQFAGA